MAEYRVHDDPPFTLRIDTPHAALAAAHAGHGVDCSAYVTACNPYGREVDETDNARRHATLGRTLAARGFACIEGAGHDPTGAWRAEPSWLVFGLDSEAAKALGVELQQNALLWSGADAVPRLVVLR